jgi:hypothetical protein
MTTTVTVSASTAVVTVEETSATVNVVGSNAATVAVGGNVAPEVPFTVGGGTSGNQPTFSGSPLFSGSYVLLDRLVHFRINVEMTNITNFGTGQYFVTLPFNSAHTYLTSNGHLHDVSANRDYTLQGHVLAGTNVLQLFYTGSNGQQDEFEHNKPVNLATADLFHISGTYMKDGA